MQNQSNSPDQQVDQTPPSSVEAEEALLGSILMNPSVYWVVVQIVCTVDFFIARHMWIWDVIATLSERNDAVDNITVMQELRNRGQLEDAGGPAYITYLINSTPTHINAATYAEIVYRASVRRRLLNAAATIAQLALEENAEISEVIDRAEMALYNATNSRNNISSSTLGAAVSGIYDDIEEQYNNPDKKIGLPTGFQEIDEMLKGGLRRKKLYYVAARPGRGKTSWLLQVATNIARFNKSRVAIFTFEMDKEEISYRILSQETAITAAKLEGGQLDDREWGLLTEATGKLSDLKITIDDPDSMSVMQVRSRCRQLQREYGLDLVIIDYIQLMNSLDRYKGNKNLELGETSRLLKILSRELNVPVLVACQLNRDGNTDEPDLEHLRDSGSLEQDADVVIMIGGDNDKNPNLAKFLVRKHRGGPKGKIETGWNGMLTTFYPLQSVSSIR